MISKQWTGIVKEGLTDADNFGINFPLDLDVKVQSDQCIECEGWKQHSSLIFLIILFSKPNIEVSGWLYQTKTHFTHIVYHPL